MDAETARFLTDHTNDTFEEDISFSDQDIPSKFMKLTPNKNKSSGAAKNRKKFLSAAPSMMKLIQCGTTNDTSSIAPTVIHNDYNSDDDDPQPKRGHGKKGSVVDEILSMNAKSLSDDDDDYDMKLLAKQAALEFQTLCKQNDELFHEKESIKHKYDDQQQTIIELQETISSMEIYKTEIETLKMENEKYITQLMVLDEEKQLYQQQVQELQAMDIQQFQNEMNMDINIDNTMENDMGNTMGNGSEIVHKMIDNSHENNDFLREQISRLTQENRQMLQEFDSYKVEIEGINDLKSKLKASEMEVERLSNALTEQQTNYIELEMMKQNQINTLTQVTTANIDDVLVEYESKAKEYVETIENQQKMIDKLNMKNEQLDEERTSMVQTKSDAHMALTRLKTDINLFGGDNNIYDDALFGDGQMTSPLPDDESYESENLTGSGDDKEMIAKLQTELTTLQKKMSYIEDEEQSNIDKLLAIANMGESNNNILKQQFQTDEEDEEDEEVEYEEIEEEVEVEVTDDEDELIDIETLNEELQEKEQELITVKAEKDQVETKMNNALKQNEELLNYVEEMESILQNAHTEKENLNRRIEDMEASLEDKGLSDMNEVKNNNDDINNEIAGLEKRKEELENMVNDFKGEYGKLKAKHEHDRKRFEKDEKKVMIEIKDRERVLEELQQQIEEYEELKKLSEEDRSRNDVMALNLDMVNSLNITIAKLQDEISGKSEQLKQEKDSHFETLERLTRLQDQMDMLSGDLKIARKSSADTSYRNENRIEQLENTIIELNSQVKEEHDKMTKSKSVIMSLRSENREFEEELMKMNDQMEQEHKQLQEQRRMSIQRMNDVVTILETNEENQHLKESQINNMKKENDEITQQLANLAQNIANNKAKWNENEKRYRDGINRLEKEKQEIIELLEEERSIMESAMNAKVNTLTATNNEIEELRNVIKSQQMELEQLNNKGLFDDLWSWS